MSGIQRNIGRRFLLSVLSVLWSHSFGAQPLPMSPSIKTAGDAESNTQVLFIHGSPGAKENYDDYLVHPDLQHVSMIAVDRLGFGESGSAVETSLQAQAEALRGLLSENKENWLVGHSLGATIALQLALLEPEKVSGLVLIAPAFDPALESPKWYNYLTDTLLASWLLPDDLLKSNQEMMALEKNLTMLAAQNWQVLDMPVLLIHGEEDGLASPGNSHFAESRLPHAKLAMLADEGHFVLWENVPLLVSLMAAQWPVQIGKGM